MVTHCLRCSYDAGEDNEISFKEGDRITHIEAVSDDWWQGTEPNGNVGLFPGTFFLIVTNMSLANARDCIANYVELQA